jgi:hypothetical protein
VSTIQDSFRNVFAGAGKSTLVSLLWSVVLFNSGLKVSRLEIPLELLCIPFGLYSRSDSVRSVRDICQFIGKILRLPLLDAASFVQDRLQRCGFLCYSLGLFVACIWTVN